MRHLLNRQLSVFDPHDNSQKCEAPIGIDYFGLTTLQTLTFVHTPTYFAKCWTNLQNADDNERTSGKPSPDRQTHTERSHIIIAQVSETQRPSLETDAPINVDQQRAVGVQSISQRLHARTLWLDTRHSHFPYVGCAREDVGRERCQPIEWQATAHGKATTSSAVRHHAEYVMHGGACDTC